MVTFKYEFTLRYYDAAILVEMKQNSVESSFYMCFEIFQLNSDTKVSVFRAN